MSYELGPLLRNLNEIVAGRKEIRIVETETSRGKARTISVVDKPIQR